MGGAAPACRRSLIRSGTLASLYRIAEGGSTAACKGWAHENGLLSPRIPRSDRGRRTVVTGSKRVEAVLWWKFATADAKASSLREIAATLLQPNAVVRSGIARDRAEPERRQDKTQPGWLVLVGTRIV